MISRFQMCKRKSVHIDVVGQGSTDPPPCDTPTTEVVSHDRAKEALTRLIAGAFRRDGERLSDERRPRFSIPARPAHDDDLVLMTYVEQQEARDAGQ